jgi:hypothetical protein
MGKRKNHSRTHERLIARVEIRLAILLEEENRVCSCPAWEPHAKTCPVAGEIAHLKSDCERLQIGIAERVARLKLNNFPKALLLSRVEAAASTTSTSSWQ